MHCPQFQRDLLEVNVQPAFELLGCLVIEYAVASISYEKILDIGEKTWWPIKKNRIISFNFANIRLLLPKDSEMS
ncbi:hypothetical protein OUZ56_015433 [Daphnia magna]|uniref:Uncharacterized protein n=1 Tax=Daphnia magna TaxID=35525 RepID=A0ABR0AMW5_9CRUS|nr:hypothetical protein OUZ56_015433 [Daphnia magna]